MTRTWRRLLLLVHVLTSVAWMTAATTLLLLLGLAAATDDTGEARAAATMAEHLDLVLLAPVANASLFTGLVLALGTPWGLVTHRWILIKLAITVAQIHVGVLGLSAWLHTAADAGTSVTPVQYAVGVAMPVAIAFQAWLSLAKPGGRTRWSHVDDRGRPHRLPTAPAGVLVAAVAAVVADLALSIALGFPFMFLEAAVLVAVGVRRRRDLERARRAPRRPQAPETQVPVRAQEST